MNKKAFFFVIPLILLGVMGCDSHSNDVPNDEENNSVLISLNPDMWNVDDAWFGAYCWNEKSQAWFTLTSDGTYCSCEIDTQIYTNIIFVRFANTATVASWDNSATDVWNQTSDLTFDGNCYTITGWNLADGYWSTI
ncbi:MAG: hypothetical protein WCS49_02055 [Bacilli bacterium]